MIMFQCTCGKRYTMTDDKAGAKVRCPACGAAGDVPGLSQTEQTGDPTPDPVPVLSSAPATELPTLPEAPTPEPARGSVIPMVLAGAAFAAVCLLVLGLYLTTRAARNRTDPAAATTPEKTQEGTEAKSPPATTSAAATQAAPGTKTDVATKRNPPTAEDRLKAGLPTEDPLKGGLQTKTMDPADLFRAASPAVVRVEVCDRDFRPTGQGSGFLVSEDGLVVTNYHVIEDAQLATVLLSNELRCIVEGVVAWDRSADLALLKIQGKKLPCLEVSSPALRRSSSGPSEASVQPLPEIGAKVYAIGSPKGLTNTLSEGLVSGHREIRLGLQAIQTTAAISPGSSGGPLLTADGKVAGVTTLFLQGGQNLNFAVPADRVAKLIGSRGAPRSFASVREAEAKTPLPTGPTEPDPLGFVGTWIEHWPGVNLHDINVVTYWKGHYGLQVRNPQTGLYRIDNVRLDGAALKFTECPAPNVAIDYEVRIQDPNTCIVKTFGGPTPGANILWFRDLTAPMPIAPPGPKDLVATLKWQTAGTDVDLLIVGPNKAMFQAVRDCRSGPGEETCLVRNPPPGDYKIVAMYPDSKGGQRTEATIEVKIGDKAIGTYQALLERDRDSKIVTTVNVTP